MTGVGYGDTAVSHSFSFAPRFTRAGVREASFLDPVARKVEVRDLAAGAGETFRQDAVAGSRALPGFAALFPR
jgi:hypothetical protein